jgi:hypothetical protein
MGAEATTPETAASDQIDRNDHSAAFFVRESVESEISKRVIRQKLAKLRHLVVEKAISAEYLDELFPFLLKHFQPQTVVVRQNTAGIFYVR